jgi:hypothetical protein
MAKPVNIELMVRVSDDSFETRLSFPIDAAKDQRDAVVKMWLEAMQVAVTAGQAGAQANP